MRFTITPRCPRSGWQFAAWASFALAASAAQALAHTLSAQPTPVSFESVQTQTTTVPADTIQPIATVVTHTPDLIVFTPRVVTAAEIQAATSVVGPVSSALDVVMRVRPNLVSPLTASGCPDVRAVYVDQQRVDLTTDRESAIKGGDIDESKFSPAVAAALRRIKAGTIAELRYVDCTSRPNGIPQQNVFWITTRTP